MTICFACIAAVANADTLAFDFEIEQTCPRVLDLQGMRFVNARGAMCFTQGTGANSVSNGSLFSNDVEGFTVTQLAGDTFTPVSIDLAEFSISVGAPDPVQFIGTKPGGAMVMVEVVLDGVCDGAGGVEDFESFTFPPRFADIVRLECPTSAWSMDNLVVEADPPPPFPEGLRVGASYASAEFLTIRDDALNPTVVLGPGLRYISGIPSYPSKYVRLFGEGGFDVPGRQPSYDELTDSVVYISGTTIYRRGRASHETVISLAELQGETGLPITGVYLPRAAGDRVIFHAYVPGDPAADPPQEGAREVFEIVNGALTNILSSCTRLPDGSGGLSDSDHNPVVELIAPEFYVFSAWMGDPPNLWRLYLKRDGKDFELLASQGDVTPFGAILSFYGFHVDAAGQLLVKATTSGGVIALRYDAGVPVGEEFLHPATVETAPVDCGLVDFGYPMSSVTGTTLMMLVGSPYIPGRLYQEHEGQYYRVLGEGDPFDGGIITSLRVVEIQEDPPARVVILVRLDTHPGKSREYLLTLAPPIDHLPQLGLPVIDPETGKVYLHFGHMTAGRSYCVETSSGLDSWSVLHEVTEVEPQRVLLVQPPPGSAFFRIAEE